MSLVKYETNLEKKDYSIEETLNWKLEQLQESKCLVEHGLADYIADGVTNIDEKIKELTNYKNLINEQVKDLKEHKDTVLIECASWLNDKGIDKLKGVKFSSITISKGKEALVKSKLIPVYECGDQLFGDKDELIQFLVDKGFVKVQQREELTPVAATSDKIRVNSKRK